MKVILAAFFSLAFVSNCWSEQFDVLIKGGMVFDGTGGEGRRVDVALKGDRGGGMPSRQRGNVHANARVCARRTSASPSYPCSGRATPLWLSYWIAAFGTAG